MGAFNNRRVRRRPASWTHHPAWQNALNEALASSLVLQTGKRNPDNFIAWLAAFGHAARATGGGVCTYFAALTCGILTTIAPSGTEILLVYSTADHQFCVISYNNSPWYTVDPWTLNAYVLKWERSYFGPGRSPKGGVDNYFKVTVHEPVDIPYCIAFNPHDVERLLREAKASLGPKGNDDMAHNFGHCCNAPNLGDCGGQGANNLDGRSAVQTYQDWG